MLTLKHKHSWVLFLIWRWICVYFKKRKEGRKAGLGITPNMAVPKGKYDIWFINHGYTMQLMVEWLG